MKDVSKMKEVYLYENISASAVIGKYAYNSNWNEGGIIIDINERGFSLDKGTCHSTCTGNSVFDSLYINGFKVYEID